LSHDEDFASVPDLVLYTANKKVLRAADRSGDQR
jgi:hypothetical protein